MAGSRPSFCLFPVHLPPERAFYSRCPRICGKPYKPLPGSDCWGVVAAKMPSPYWRRLPCARCCTSPNRSAIAAKAGANIKTANVKPCSRTARSLDLAPSAGSLSEIGSLRLKLRESQCAFWSSPKGLAKHQGIIDERAICYYRHGSAESQCYWH